MKKFNLKNNKLLIGLTIAFAISCDSSEKVESRVEFLPYYEEASFTPLWLEAGSSEIKKLHKIPSFNLINQEGNSVTDETVDGMIYITDFFFTSCPGICPKMTDNMYLLQEEFLLDEDVLLLSHSVTPIQDSVSVLKKYAVAKGVNSSKWHLLTGDSKEIYSLGRKSYFVEEDLGLQKGDFDFIHTENFVLVDKHRHIRGIYNGLNQTSLQQLISDVRSLQKEVF